MRSLRRCLKSGGWLGQTDAISKGTKWESQLHSLSHNNGRGTGIPSPNQRMNFEKKHPYKICIDPQHHAERVDHKWKWPYPLFTSLWFLDSLASACQLFRSCPGNIDHIPTDSDQSQTRSHSAALRASGLG